MMRLIIFITTLLACVTAFTFESFASDRRVPPIGQTSAGLSHRNRRATIVADGKMKGELHPVRI